MILRGQIRRASGDLPPARDVEMVREESRTIAASVTGVPAGRSVVQLIDTGKLLASDPDTATLYQKNLTLTSDLATVGQITDDGATSRVCRATIQFTKGDSLTWPDRIERQLWVALDDGTQFCVLTGAITTLAPIPVALPTVVASITVTAD